jgi:hypothetical protein
MIGRTRVRSRSGACFVRNVAVISTDSVQLECRDWDVSGDLGSPALVKRLPFGKSGLVSGARQALLRDA